MRDKKGRRAKLGKRQSSDVNLLMLHDYRQSQSANR
jgi:hypothetical protein